MGEYVKNIKKARMLYLEKGVLKRELLRDEIVYSWVRSRLINIDYTRPPYPSVPEMIRGNVSDIIRLLKLNDYGLDQIGQALESFFIVDSKGNLEKAWTNLPINRFYFNFSEDSFGTSGIALAIKNAKKSYTVSYEHYHDMLTEKVSIGVPTSDGKIAGFIFDYQKLSTEIDFLMSRLPEQLSSLTFNTNDISIDESESDSLELDFKASVHTPACLQGNSSEISNVRMRIEKLINSPLIFITGQKGIGKESTAHYIHRLRTRNNEKFYSVYCDKVPFKRFESEWLKNSEKVSDNLKLYNIGTVYFENFSALPRKYQRKLLRMIDSKLVNSKAEDVDISRDIRFVISYESLGVEALTSSGLTPSLQSRVKLSEINLPNIESRTQDICPIIRHLIIEKTVGQSLEVDIQDENIIRGLDGIKLPGNLRDLDIITDGIIETCSISDQKIELNLMDYLQAYLEKEETASSLKTLDLIEEEAIRNTLEALNYNMVQSAKVLGISRSTLYRKIEQYDIDLNGVR